LLALVLALQEQQRAGKERGGQEVQQARALQEVQATREEQAEEPAGACREPARVEGPATGGRQEPLL
tara:strand:- start:459 stop:659 length:201 start_codon:yes stop_codon:yes gene_type:complete